VSMLPLQPAAKKFGMRAFCEDRNASPPPGPANSAVGYELKDSRRVYPFRSSDQGGEYPSLEATCAQECWGAAIDLARRASRRCRLIWGIAMSRNDFQNSSSRLTLVLRPATTTTGVCRGPLMDIMGCDRGTRLSALWIHLHPVQPRSPAARNAAFGLS
jgi:hypothetical protein